MMVPIVRCCVLLVEAWRDDKYGSDEFMAKGSPHRDSGSAEVLRKQTYRQAAMLTKRLN